VDSNANIDPTITGTVANLSVSVGDKVEKGQFLFEIKNDDLSPNVTKAYSSYLQSLGSLETAKANKKEAKNNYDDASSSTKSILKKKLEAAEISVTVAEENIKYALDNYNNEKKNYADRKVTAPIAGTVNAVNIKNGDDLSKLSSGSSRQVPIIIGDLGTLKAQVAVNEVDMPNIQIGQKTTLKFDAFSEKTFEGKIEKIDSLGTVSQGVVTYNVVVDFNTQDSNIRPEMSVSADILTGEKQDVIFVPNSALKNEGSNYFVETLVNGSPKRKPVKIGIANNINTEITEGLQAGDKIITQTIDPNATAATSSNRGFGGFGH
jgi:HlyD family secretion protein